MGSLLTPDADWLSFRQRLSPHAAAVRASTGMAASQNQNRSILCWIIVGALVLTLNLHYVLLGQSIVGGLFNSPLLEPLNAVWRHKTIQALHEHNIPPSNHTEDLGHGLQIDI